MTFWKGSVVRTGPVFVLLTDKLGVLLVEKRPGFKVFVAFVSVSMGTVPEELMLGSDFKGSFTALEPDLLIYNISGALSAYA